MLAQRNQRRLGIGLCWLAAVISGITAGVALRTTVALSLGVAIGGAFVVGISTGVLTGVVARSALDALRLRAARRWLNTPSGVGCFHAARSLLNSPGGTEQNLRDLYRAHRAGFTSADLTALVAARVGTLAGVLRLAEANVTVDQFVTAHNGQLAPHRLPVDLLHAVCTGTLAAQDIRAAIGCGMDPLVAAHVLRDGVPVALLREFRDAGMTMTTASVLGPQVAVHGEDGTRARLLPYAAVRGRNAWNRMNVGDATRFADAGLDPDTIQRYVDVGCPVPDIGGFIAAVTHLARLTHEQTVGWVSAGVLEPANPYDTIATVKAWIRDLGPNAHLYFIAELSLDDARVLQREHGDAAAAVLAGLNRPAVLAAR